MKRIVFPAVILLTAALLSAGCSNKDNAAQDPADTQESILSEISETTKEESSSVSSHEAPAESSEESPQESSDAASSKDEDPSASSSESPEPSHDESSGSSEKPESSAEESSEISEISSEPFDPNEDITTVYKIENKYFVNKLNEQEKKSFAVLYHAAENFESGATFRHSVAEDDFDKLMWLLNYDCPELIHLKGDYAPHYDYSGNVNGVKFYYSMTKNEYSGCMEELNGFFSELKQQTAGMSMYDAEKYVYDYMFSSIVYTETTEYSGSAYGSLIDRKARCEGISKGFAWCMNVLGFECMTISGYPNWDSGSLYATHSWNIIHLEDGYYNVDLTTDNLREDEDQTVMPLYSFLNQCDEIMSRTHTPLGIYADLGIPACVSEKMNYHVMNGLVITPDEDNKTRLDELLDRFYSPEGEISIPIRFISSESYEDFLDNWESCYSDYLEEKGFVYRYASLYSNDVGKTVVLYIEE